MLSDVNGVMGLLQLFFELRKKGSKDMRASGTPGASSGAGVGHGAIAEQCGNVNKGLRGGLDALHIAAAVVARSRLLVCVAGSSRFLDDAFGCCSRVAAPAALKHEPRGHEEAAEEKGLRRLVHPACSRSLGEGLVGPPATSHKA